MYLLLSRLFSHNYKAVVLLAESFFRLFQSFFFLEEPKLNNLLSFVSKKALLFFSVKQEKFSTRPSLGRFFVDILCISYWRMKYKNVETSKQNKKYFYRLRATIIAHPEIVFEKWVSPKMVQETEKRWVTKNTFPQQLLLLYLSVAAITTKTKMASNED